MHITCFYLAGMVSGVICKLVRIPVVVRFTVRDGSTLYRVWHSLVDRRVAVSDRTYLGIYASKYTGVSNIGTCICSLTSSTQSRTRRFSQRLGTTKVWPLSAR